MYESESSNNKNQNPTPPARFMAQSSANGSSSSPWLNELWPRPRCPTRPSSSLVRLMASPRARLPCSARRRSVAWAAVVDRKTAGACGETREKGRLRLLLLLPRAADDDAGACGGDENDDEPDGPSLNDGPWLKDNPRAALFTALVTRGAASRDTTASASAATAAAHAAAFSAATLGGTQRRAGAERGKCTMSTSLQDPGVETHEQQCTSNQQRVPKGGRQGG